MLNWQGWAATNFVGWGSVGVDAPAVTTPAVGHVGKPRRKREYVEIDGQYFEVKDQKQAIEILTKLHEAAKETAAAAAKEAVAKAVAKKVKPEVVAPRMAVVKPDYSKAFVQELQAKVDATNAQIAEIYKQAVAAEMKAAEEAHRLAVIEQSELEELMGLMAKGLL